MNSNKKGFTIVENLIVILIILLIGTFALNFSKNFVENSLVAQTKNLFLQAFILAKSEALNNEIDGSSGQDVSSFLFVNDKIICVHQFNSSLTQGTNSCSSVGLKWGNKLDIPIIINNSNKFCFAFDKNGLLMKNKSFSGLSCITNLNYKLQQGDVVFNGKVY